MPILEKDEFAFELVIPTHKPLGKVTFDVEADNIGSK